MLANRKAKCNSFSEKTFRKAKTPAHLLISEVNTGVSYPYKYIRVRAREREQKALTSHMTNKGKKTIILYFKIIQIPDLSEPSLLIYPFSFSDLIAL